MALRPGEKADTFAVVQEATTLKGLKKAIGIEPPGEVILVCVRGRYRIEVVQQRIMKAL